MKQLLIFSVAILTFASCQKLGNNNHHGHNNLIELNNNVVIQMDNSHEFILPEDAGAAFIIVEDALNAQVSEIGTNTDGQAIYTYRPHTSFTGTDQVILSNVQEDRMGCGVGSGSCGDNEEEDKEKRYNITLNIDVQSEAGDN